MNKFNYLIITSILILSLFFFNCEKKNPANPFEHNKWFEINQGLTNFQIRDIAISTSNPEEIYVATSQGIFRSKDGGNNWIPKNIGLTCLDITDIEIISQDNGIVLAGSWGGGIFKSENSGDSWTAINNGLADPRVFVVTASYESNPTYYAGTESGLFQNMTNLEMWEKVVIPGDGGATTSIAIPSRDSTTIYVGIKYAGVYKSKNSGATWEAKNNGLVWTQENGFVTPSAIKVDLVDNNRIFMGAGWLGLYLSTDAGESWTLKSSWPAGAELKCLAVNPNNFDEIFVGTNNGVLHTVDTGNSYVAMNDGLTNLDVRALAFDPKDPRIIYAGTMGGGIFKYVRE